MSREISPPTPGPSAPRERKIGWIVLLIVAAVALVAIGIVAARESASLRYSILFRDAKNLQQGDRVQMKGVDIGVVKTVELIAQPPRVKVHVKIQPVHAKKVGSDSTAVIRNVAFPNVSGQMIVEVLNSNTTPPAPPMQDGAEIDGMDSMLGLKAWQLKNAIDLNSENIGEALNEIGKSIEGLAGDLQDLAESPQVKDAMKELNKFLGEMQQDGRAAAQRLAQEWPAIKQRLIPVLEQVREAGRKVLSEQFDTIIRQIEETLKLWGQETPVPTPVHSV